MSIAAVSSTTPAGPGEALGECLPQTPLHAMIAKALSKGATLFHVGRHGTGAKVQYWDRHRVDGVLQNGDFLAVGAREMARVLALTPPLAIADPGERLLYSLRATLDGDLSVVVQCVVESQATWWHVGYDHSLERLVAEQLDSATPPAGFSPTRP